MERLSWEDASLLLKKYLGTSVKGLLFSMDGKASARLTGILEIEEKDGERWLTVTDDDNRLALLFSSCIYVYSDPRSDARGKDREGAIRDLESVLSVINTELRISLNIFEAK